MMKLKMDLKKNFRKIAEGNQNLYFLCYSSFYIIKNKFFQKIQSQKICGGKRKIKRNRIQ